MDSSNSSIAAAFQPHSSPSTHLSIIDSNSQTIALPGLPIKLDRENYYLWQSTVYSAFEAFDLEAHLDGSNIPSATVLTTTQGTSDSTPNPAFTAWKKRDKILLLWLKTTMSHSILPYIMHICTTREAWSYLSNLFQSQSRARVMQLRHQLQTTTKGSFTIMDYVDKKRTISHSLALAARPITDEELMSAILFGLDSSYGSFRSAINPHLENLTTDSLLSLLLQEEEKLVEETKALQLQANAISRQYSNRSPITGQSNQQSFTTSQKSSGRPNNINPSRSSSRSSPRIICQICEKPNHHARNCYNRNNMDSYPPNRSSNRPQANMVTPSDNMMSPSAIVNNSWFADSGATNHVTSDLSQLSIHTDYNGEDHLAVGNGQKLSIHHTGSSKLPCFQLSHPQLLAHLSAHEHHSKGGMNALVILTSNFCVV
ncbi:hypothetical protein KY285_017140 [Solanum tuberosum]|nr:hypothetical protein KY285_017140 [Solanum tuberosum]